MVDAQHATRAHIQPVVLTLPDEIDITNARRLCGELGSTLSSATMVIADMSATTFCDSSGVRILMLAHDQATATGIELRLVTPSAGVLHTLALIGADRLLPVYPTLGEALAAPPVPNGQAPAGAAPG